MKKIFFLIIFFSFIINSSFARADEKNDEVLVKIKQTTDAYKKQCTDKAFPHGLDNFSMYGDDLKQRDKIYNQCLKDIIITQINEIMTKEDAQKATQNIDEIQNGINNFYWSLYNREDNGSIGRGVNDAALGRYYEQILNDIIHFRYVFNNDTF